MEESKEALVEIAPFLRGFALLVADLLFHTSEVLEELVGIGGRVAEVVEDQGKELEARAEVLF